MATPEKSAVAIDPSQHGLKQYEVKTSTVVFSLIVCMLPFGVIVVVEAFLPMFTHALILIASCVLRVKDGGLTQVYPVNDPTNPKIGLGIGDTKRLMWVFAESAPRADTVAADRPVPLGPLDRPKAPHAVCAATPSQSPHGPI